MLNTDIGPNGILLGQALIVTKQNAPAYVEYRYWSQWYSAETSIDWIIDINNVYNLYFYYFKWKISGDLNYILLVCASSNIWPNLFGQIMVCARE